MFTQTLTDLEITKSVVTVLEHCAKTVRTLYRTSFSEKIYDT
jgi:hypothetical protein